MKRLRRNPLISLTAGTVALGVLSACGGGNPPDVDAIDEGIRGTGSSIGPISGFGSVFVNGVEFDTGGAEIVSNDGVTCEPGQTCNQPLQKGMILRVEGQWREDGQGTADRVEYDDTFRGKVSNVSLTTNEERATFRIYGQQIVATTRTVFQGTSLKTLADQPFVRVSAFRNPDGRYRASFVGVVPEDSDDIEIGINVAPGEVNTANKRITSGVYTIKYSDSAFGNGVTETDLASGGAFEIEGSLGVGSTLVASSIQRDDFRRYQQGGGNDTELTGIIQTDYVPDNLAARPGEFTLAGLTIRVTDATELGDRLTVDGLTAGLLIQVEGSYTGGGAVEAEEIELRESNAKVSGQVDVNTVNPSTGQFVVGGVTVQLTPLTIVDRDADGDVNFARLTGIGTNVQVEGIERETVANTYLEALKVEVQSEEEGGPGTAFELEGTVQSRFNGSITVLGVEIETGLGDYSEEASNAIAFGSGNEQSIAVEVEYSGGSDSFAASEIELESEDDD